MPDGSNSFTEASPERSGVWPEWHRHLPLTLECTKDRPHHPFCSSSAWTLSLPTFSRLTYGHSCSPMMASWPMNNMWNSKKKPSSGTVGSASTACTWAPRRKSTWNAACKPTDRLHQDLKKVWQFKYLRSIICSDGESLPAAVACVILQQLLLIIIQQIKQMLLKASCTKACN